MRSFDAFRRQELALIAMNLSVIAAIGIIHLSYGFALGFPSRMACGLLVFRLVEQATEGIWLRRLQTALTPGQIRAYSIASPAFAIIFAFLLNALSGMDDAHYHVLMVIPIVASAFRFRLKWVLSFVALASTLTVCGVLITNDIDDGGGLRELFESTTDVLIYAVVGIVVWTLSEHLRRDSEELSQHYDKLQTMQHRLARDERLAAVGRLASAIAHEIRNPVAAIASSLAAAEDPSMPISLRQEMSKIAARESVRLEQLTSDFLAYAKEKQPELRLTDVAETVSYVASLVTAKASECSVVIKTCCNGQTQAMMDAFLIHGALLNIAINAIEASPAGSTVEIGVSVNDELRDQQLLEMYVQSAGDAIPPNVVGRIFEPFFTTKGSGTGLGLAIARNVAVAHGGKLDLTDNRPNRVRFTLAIPLVSDAAKSTSEFGRLSDSHPGAVFPQSLVGTETS